MKRVWAVIFASAAFVSCDKVPLRENHGSFDLVSAHWFANEKTEYVFFSISGLRRAQARVGVGRFQISTGQVRVAGLNVSADGYADLNLNRGVHRHHLVECGEGRLCGSFSFHAEQPVQAVNVRYFYSDTTKMQEVATMTATIHADGPTADSQSALAYGVFNADNSRVQIRIRDNFGSPNAEEIVNYGMDRKFAVENLKLVPLSANDEAQLMQNSGSNYLFPATLCTPYLASGGASLSFSGHQGWALATLDPNDASSDACFNIRSLDRAGASLNVQPALARRNPEFGSESLTLHPPIGAAQMVPIVLSYCQDRPESGQLTSPDFLRYQYFILGIPGDHPIDACFAPGDEDRFTHDLQRVLSERLAAARSAGASGDFFFAVVVHHIMSAMVHKTFRNILDKALRQKIASELTLISPRLVGAFVYDSRALDIDYGGGPIAWCPRNEGSGGADSDSVEANCTPIKLDKIDLGIVNFNIPMGPFPTVDKFVKHFQDSGDRGESRNPRLGIRSVQTNSSSVTYTGGQLAGTSFTFFDNERLSPIAGQFIRFCRDRDDKGMLQNLAFQPTQPPGGAPMGIDDVTAYLNMPGRTQAPVHVGLQWTQPFIGTFSFDAPVTGHVLSIIPLSKTFTVQESLGDPRWSQPNWDLQPLIQKCLRHCDHPYFDESGVYQISTHWDIAGRCVQPSIQEPTQ